MARGLNKATNYYNRIEAWRDWQRIAEQATQQGHTDLVARYQPPESAGWRKIDRSIAALRAAIQPQPEQEVDSE